MIKNLSRINKKSIIFELNKNVRFSIQFPKNQNHNKIQNLISYMHFSINSKLFRNTEFIKKEYISNKTKKPIFLKDLVSNPSKFFANNKKRFSDKISLNQEKNTISDYDDNPKNNNLDKTSMRKRKTKIKKKIQVRTYKEEGSSIINFISNSDILKSKSIIEDEVQAKNLEYLNREEKMYEELIQLLTEGDLKDASAKVLEILDLLKNIEFKNISQNISLIDSPIISNKIILKKIQIYKLCLSEIYIFLGKTDDAQFHLNNLISIVEKNSNNEQDNLLLLNLRLKLCNFYLEKDEIDFMELKLNEKCKKLIDTNVKFLEKKSASKEIENQQNIFLTIYIMLLENIYIFGEIYKKENNPKESINYFLKYIKIKDKYPILSQYTINMEYSLYLNLGLNYMNLHEYENSIYYFNIAIEYLKDETLDNFVQSKIMIIEKLNDIYEELANIQKINEVLEEKKRLTIKLINIKTQLVKDAIIKNNSEFNHEKFSSEPEKILDNNTNHNMNIDNNNQDNYKEKSFNHNDKKEEDCLLENKSLNNSKSKENNENNENNYRNNPLFIKYEETSLKKDYLNLAKIYEELVEFNMENEIYLENIEEYIIEAEKYYKMINNQTDLFAVNLYFIWFLKHYDDCKFDIALEYSNKIINALQEFEKFMDFLSEEDSIDSLNQQEIEFFQIDENFFMLSDMDKKEYLLRRYTTLDWYKFETRFKIYFYISKIYCKLSIESEKNKYQNLALKEYENAAEKENISVLHKIDLMTIYEQKKMNQEFYGMFDTVASEIKDGKLDFIRKDDQELYTNSIYDVYYMKINYLIFENRYQEAKDTLKVLDGIALINEDIKFSYNQKDNLDKTLNLLDLKLKYIAKF